MDERRRLTRSESDRMVAGVCGGLGEHLGIDPTLVRIVFVILALFGASGLVLYVALWLIVPPASRADADPRDVLRDGVEEGRSLAHQGADAARRGYRRLRGTEPPQDGPTTGPGGHGAGDPNGPSGDAST
jgi:phage shock protein C